MIFFYSETWVVLPATRLLHLQILPLEIQQIGWQMKIGFDFDFNFGIVWIVVD